MAIPRFLTRRTLILATLAYALTATLLWWSLDPRPRLKLTAPEPMGLVGFTPDGQTLVTMARHLGPHPERSSGPVRFWDVTTGQERFRLLEDTNGLFQAKLSPDGKRLAAQVGRELRVFDVASREQIAEVECSRVHEYPTELTWSPDGNALAYFAIDAAGNFAPARVFDVETGQVTREFAGVTGRPLLFSPDGQRLVTGFRHESSFQKNGTGVNALRVWSIPTGELLATIGALDNLDYKSFAVFSPDGERLWFNNGGRGIAGVHVPSGKEEVFLGQAYWVHLIPAGRHVVVNHVDSRRAAGWFRKVGVYDAQNGKEVRTLFVDAEAHSGGGLATSPDGTWAGITRTNRRHPRVRDLWQAVEVLGRRTGLTFLRDRGFYYELHLLDVTGERDPVRLPGCDRYLFSPDNRFVATTCENSISYNDGKVLLWDLPPAKPYLAIFGWALVAPGLVLAWRSWRRTRRQRSAT